MGWMMTAGNVTGKKNGKDFAFPVNISLTVAKYHQKWLIAAMHSALIFVGLDDFSTLTGGRMPAAKAPNSRHRICHYE